MKIGVLVGASLLSLSLVGCMGSNSNVGSTNTVAVEEMSNTQNVSISLEKLPKNLDPQLNSEREASFIINNLNEGLMCKVGAELVNGMAESYTVSEDGLTYTFTLRKAKWSDGETVKASDFEEAWKKGVDPLNGGAHRTDYQNAKIKNAGAIIRGEMSSNALGVLALDTRILEVTLEEANPDFIEYITREAFLPYREEVAENGTNKKKDKETEEKEVIPSNGPFKLMTFDQSGIKLVKNKNYWNAKHIFLETIDASILEDQEQATNQYLKDQVDIFIGKLTTADTNAKADKSTEETTNDETVKNAEDTEVDVSNENEEIEDETNSNTVLVHDWIEGWELSQEGVLKLNRAYVTK